MIKLIKDVLRKAAGVNDLSGGVFIDFSVMTQYVDGYSSKHYDERFTIPKGGVIDAWIQMQFSGEPFPIGTSFKVVLDPLWARFCTTEIALDSSKNALALDGYEDDYDARANLEGEFTLTVKVASINREDGFYRLETEPKLRFDFSHRFQEGFRGWTLRRSWLDIEEALLRSVNLYRDDPKFLRFVRWEIRDS